MSASPLLISTQPEFLTARTLKYDAQDLRRITDDNDEGVGVAGYESWRVRQRVAGANMSVDCSAFNVLSRAWLRGTSFASQGLYRVDNLDLISGGFTPATGPFNLDIAAADPVNPRIDQIYLAVEDAQHAGANNQATLRVVAGTATGGATLDNRTGVGAAPANMAFILLADVLVPAASVSVVTANIRDRRPVADPGIMPWAPAGSVNVDVVQLKPCEPLALGQYGTGGNAYAITAGTHDNMHSVILCWNPTRIIASRLRFKYQQGSTANAGNYVLYIADASGRVIASTAATAFAGALGTITQALISLLASVTIEKGWVYAGIGIGAMTAVSTMGWAGPDLKVSSSGNNGIGGPSAPGQAFRNAAGGAVVPTTILGHTDLIGVGGVTEVPRAPLLALVS